MEQSTNSVSFPRQLKPIVEGIPSLPNTDESRASAPGKELALNTVAYKNILKCECVGSIPSLNLQ